MAGIYIHIPFCRSKCSYCDFFSVGSIERMQGVLTAIIAELERERDFIGVGAIDTIYFGGGTPSVYSPDQIQSVIDVIEQLWDCSSVTEITMEANPDDLTHEYLAQLKRTKINRLSIGIQSFDDADLRLMNRRHTAQAAIDVVANAQREGFDNITIDLIYGVPGMSNDTWKRNIEQALSLGIQHISAYHLSIEEKSRFGRMAARGEIAAVDENVSQQQYMLLHNILVDNGFEHYEISNFAREGFRARHNSAYWSGEPYLGVGPSAHSFNGNVRRWSKPSIVDYLESGNDAADYETEQLTPVDAYNEFVMTSLRRAEGVNTDELECKFGARKLQYFMDMAVPSLTQGTLVKESGRIVIPYQYFLIADSIICELFDND